MKVYQRDKAKGEFKFGDLPEDMRGYQAELKQPYTSGSDTFYGEHNS